MCGAPAVANDEPCCMGVTAGGAGAARRALDKPITVVEGSTATAVSGYERLNVRDGCERDVCVCLRACVCVCASMCVHAVRAVRAVLSVLSGVHLQLQAPPRMPAVPRLVLEHGQLCCPSPLPKVAQLEL